MPARSVRSNPFSVTGRVSTEKSLASQEAESMLEHDFLTLLEFDERVELFAAQPITIRWEDDTGKHRYTPDVGVKYRDSACQRDLALRITFFEVKPRGVLKRDWQSLRPRFKAMIAWTLERDMRFHLITEREIRTPYLENARFLLRYRRDRMPRNIDLDAHRQWRVREALYGLKTSTPRDLLKAISPVEHYQTEFLPWIWYLVNCRLIGCDLTKRLTMVSPIWSLETEDTIRRMD